jgi:hypothetical protein
VASGGRLGQPRRGVGEAPEEGLAGQRRGSHPLADAHKQRGLERHVFEVIANEVLFLDRAERQKPEDATPPVGGGDNPF